MKLDCKSIIVCCLYVIADLPWTCSEQVLASEGFISSFKLLFINDMRSRSMKIPPNIPPPGLDLGVCR
jgi:hypothetical protein